MKLDAHMQLGTQRHIPDGHLGLPGAVWGPVGTERLLWVCVEVDTKSHRTCLGTFMAIWQGRSQHKERLSEVRATLITHI